jgi:hypothetical protein
MKATTNSAGLEAQEPVNRSRVRHKIGKSCAQGMRSVYIRIANVIVARPRKTVTHHWQVRLERREVHNNAMIPPEVMLV